MRGRGGPITAAVDGPGGPILVGDHRRRDRLPTVELCNYKTSSELLLLYSLIVKKLQELFRIRESVESMYRWCRHAHQP